MSRIKLTDTGLDAMMKMSNGNPGAIACMTTLMGEAEGIDPESMMGGMGAILSLDNMGIYGTDIYILWSDKCGKDIRKLLMLLRAKQLGFFPEARLKEMAADQMREVNITDEELESLNKQVCDYLPSFKRG